MAGLVLVACVLLLVISPSLSDYQASFEDEVADFKLLMDILSKPRELERNYKNDFNRVLVQNYFREQYGEMDPGLPVNRFSWKNCGSPSDPFKMMSFSLSPDPIRIPGNITVGANAKIGTPLIGPIKVAVTLQKKIIIWITLPCIGGVGSCTYRDLCTFLSRMFPRKCPPYFSQHKLPCRCPLKPGQYVVSQASLYLKPARKIPSFLKRGDYKLIAKMSHQGQSIGCIEFNFSLA